MQILLAGTNVTFMMTLSPLDKSILSFPCFRSFQKGCVILFPEQLTILSTSTQSVDITSDLLFTEVVGGHVRA